jgi:hypothetical protein
MKMYVLKRVAIAAVVIGITAVIFDLFGYRHGNQLVQLAYPLVSYVFYELLSGRFTRIRSKEGYDLGRFLMASLAANSIFGVVTMNDSAMFVLFGTLSAGLAVAIVPQFVPAPLHSAFYYEKALYAAREQLDLYEYEVRYYLGMAEAAEGVGESEAAAEFRQSADIARANVAAIKGRMEVMQKAKRSEKPADIDSVLEALEQRRREEEEV